MSGHWSQPLEFIAKVSLLNVDEILGEGQNAVLREGCKHRALTLTRGKRGLQKTVLQVRTRSKKSGARPGLPTN